MTFVEERVVKREPSPLLNIDSSNLAHLVCTFCFQAPCLEVVPLGLR